MQIIPYTEARKNLANTMNYVCTNHMPVIITQQKSEPVVMISLEDYNSIEETLYLLKSPRNAERIAKAVTEIEEKKFLHNDLLED